MRAHLLVENKRGEILVDGEVDDFLVFDELACWTTYRILGEGREKHEHELAMDQVARLELTQATGHAPVLLPGR